MSLFIAVHLRTLTLSTAFEGEVSSPDRFIR